MNTDITFGSVCSGIEAASVAWGPLGWRAAWLAEIEPFPSAVLAHHYPDVRNLGDMSRLPQRIAGGDVEAPDVFCGGTPCQAFSVAGLRRSLDDARGNLSLIFCEIVNAIDTVRVARGEQPAIVFWENVPGVLSTKDNAFGCFLAGLAGEDDPLVAPGGKWTNSGAVFGPTRTVAWRVLDAQYFGVAQRRRRVFVVASARKGFDPAQVLFEWDGVRRDTAPSREARQVAPTIPSRSTAGGGLGTDFDIDGGVIQATTHTLRGEGFDASEDGTGRGTPLAPVAMINMQGSKGNAVAQADGPSFTLNAMHGHDMHAVAVPVGVTIHGTDPTVQKVASYDELAQCLRARTPGNIDNSSTTVVQQPVSYGIRTANTSSNGWGIQEEVTHTLDCAQGVAVAQPVSFAIQAGALRTNPLSGPDGIGVQADHAYTLEARAEVQAVAIYQGENNGRMDGGTPQSQNDLPAGAVRGLRRCECGGASQERGLEGSPTGELAAPVQKLPHESASVGEEMHAVRQPAQGAGLLRDALPAFQEVGRPDSGQGQPVHDIAQGLRSEPAEGVSSAGLHGEVPREGVLQQARAAGAQGNTWPATNEQVRGVPGSMAVRRLLPVECERLQGFPAVSEKVTIEACLDHQNQSVHVALKCLRWQNSAYPAGVSELMPLAKTAAVPFSTSQASPEPLAALHARMHSVDELLEIRSAGRLIWSANGADASKKSLPSTLTGNTVPELARLLREVGHSVRSGRAASPLNISLSFPASSGATSAEKSGRETAESASGAESAQNLVTFTTSDLGQITTCCDSTAATLCCSVLHAIAGCIPNETLPATFSIELTVETPYTAIPWRKKPASECPDGPRYKALGNSWAVPVVAWIGRRIDASLRSAS